MSRDHNVIGRNVAKFRYQRAWTQDDLVGKLQLLGCYMTRDILANIETQRGPVTDMQIEFFAESAFQIALIRIRDVFKRVAVNDDNRRIHATLVGITQLGAIHTRLFRCLKLNGFQQ